MSVDRAANILTVQLAAAIMDGKKFDWKKRNYCEALKCAISVLHEKMGVENEI